jgi:hypothetical protein
MPVLWSCLVRERKIFGFTSDVSCDVERGFWILIKKLII